MPLSTAVARKPLHTRAITYSGYQRDDGLWDVEAHLSDIKAYTFHNAWRGEVTPGDPIHDMLIRLTVDDSLTIQAVESAIELSPFAMCPDITPNYQSLIGIKIGPGWRNAIKQRISAVQGCTHLTEVLYPLATVAMQAIIPILAKKRKKEAPIAATKKSRPYQMDGCHTWATDSPVVKQYYPEYYTGDDG